MLVKTKPGDFDFMKWGLVIEAKTGSDLMPVSLLYSIVDCMKYTNEDMYIFLVITKELKIDWYASEYPLLLLDSSLADDEFYVLCQNIDGTKKLIWHSPGA